MEYVFEAVNCFKLFFYTFVAKTRPPGNGIRVLSRTLVDSSLQLSISAETIIQQAIFFQSTKH